MFCNIFSPFHLNIFFGFSGFNDSVEIYPLYEPVSAAEKITNLGNLTLYGNPEGLNLSLTIHAVRGGHVTVYFNSTTPAIKCLILFFN